MRAPLPRRLPRRPAPDLLGRRRGGAHRQRHAGGRRDRRPDPRRSPPRSRASSPRRACASSSTSPGSPSASAGLTKRATACAGCRPSGSRRRSSSRSSRAMEKANVDAGSPDGLLLNILKARQLGVSTLSEALVAHRLVTRTHIRALSGADVEEQAGYLFRMVVRIYDQLPWFLKPAKVYFNKNRELSLANQCFLKTAWGKSTRGALQSTTGLEGSKGSIGRGQTYSVVHISELPTWENPEQLDTALLPAIPYAPDTLVLYEATAEFAGDWWHQHWLASGEGVGRFRNIFIPWSAEPSKYSLPAPLAWSPRPGDARPRRQVRARQPEVVQRRDASRLTRDQLYWYETTRGVLREEGPALQVPQGVPGRRPGVLPVRRPIDLHARTARSDRPRRHPPGRSRMSGRSSPPTRSPTCAAPAQPPPTTTRRTPTSSRVASSRRSPRTSPAPRSPIAHETDAGAARLRLPPPRRQPARGDAQPPPLGARHLGVPARCAAPRRYILAVDVSRRPRPGLLGRRRHPPADDRRAGRAGRAVRHQPARPQGARLRLRRRRPLLRRPRRHRGPGRDRDQQPRPGDPGHPAAAPRLLPLLRLGVRRRRVSPSGATRPASAG